MKFNRDNVGFFSFDKYGYDLEKGAATFHYSFDDSIHFVEELVFNHAPKTLTKDKQLALDRVLKYLHLALGVSYYKAAVPSKIIIRTGEISKQTGLFFDKLYLKGLGEFAYNNNLTLKNKINFPISNNFKKQAISIDLKDRAVLPIGGGKDSLVSFDILKSSESEFCLFHIGKHKCCEDLQRIEKNNIIRVHRKISNNIIKLNEIGAFNGHIPISSIFAFVSLAVCVIYDYQAVIMSNERSANVGSIMPDGIEVNHQYSKSIEFEKDFSKLVSDEIISTYNYFSMLRPFSELSIAEMFSKITYAHDIFISCNQASKQKNQSDQWCLNCPKCRFVFLSLSPYIKKKNLINIFGSNLLDDKHQLKGFMALVGIDEPKPFECVGEIEESILAFCLISKSNEWRDDFIVSRVMRMISLSHEEIDRLTEDIFQPKFDTNIPKKYLKMLNDYRKVS